MLELGVPPKDIEMQEVGEWVTCGPAIELALEGPPLGPLMGALNEESGATPVQEDGAMADDNTAV